MNRLYWVWLMALVLAGPVLGQAKKKDGAKKVDAEPVDAEKLKPGQISGKVMQASETSLQVRVDYMHYELNPKAGGKGNYGGNNQVQQLVRQQEQLARAQQRILMARNPAEQQRALYELQRDVLRMQQQMEQKAVQQQLQALSGKNGGQNLFKEVHEYKDVNVELDSKVKYRTSFLPSAFDDMGNIKKYTDAEKKELKGEGADAKLPGYKAGSDAVKTGAQVTVTLAKSKEAENKIRGTLVLVTKESDEKTSLGDGKKKPKK